MNYLTELVLYATHPHALAAHTTPGHALVKEARAEILSVANDPRRAEIPPARIVPMTRPCQRACFGAADTAGKINVEHISVKALH